MQHIDAAERASEPVWTGNWQRILPVLVAARDIVEPSLADSFERFVASPQSLMMIEVIFLRATPPVRAVFELLRPGRIPAQELHTES
ncbi:hypothetical protein [Paraburkholderia sp. RL17-373-BIF-A]|uniref:hypothetical protein n=1 Tax=Paraburkholderia sp. RL17-373-BIF-A TaxID=3031629 RepID=UPI0038B98E1A